MFKTTLTAGLSLALSASGLWAVCQCPALTPQEQKEQASSIFTASVDDIRMEKGSTVHTVILGVDDIYKGTPLPDVEAIDAMADSDCAIPFVEGQEYMVYAHWEWGTIYVSSCTGTALMIPESLQNRNLGPSDALKEQLYDRLRQGCLGTPVTLCCLDSVKSMAQGRYLPEPDGGCAAGSAPDRLKCAGSYRWCIPTSDDDSKDHRNVPSQHKAL